MIAFEIAYRFLTSSKSQMVLISLGIAIGVSVQVFIGSLIFGLQESLIDATVGSSPHITIVNDEKNKPIKDYQELEKELKDNSDLKYVSIVYDNNAFIIDEETTYPVLVRGFNYQDADKIYNFSEQLVEGEKPSKNEIIIGLDLIENLELEVNDSIVIETAFGLEKEVTIVGVFDLGITSLNETWVVTDQKTALAIFDEEDQITAIEIQIADVFAAREIAKDIETELTVNNWKDANEQLLSGLNGQSVSSLMIQIFVMISVLLAIASVLIISVVQKRRQLGILKAMGINNADSVKIFLFQGFLLGVVGATLGVVLGISLIYMFSIFAVESDGSALVEVVINYQFIALSWLIAITAACIASIIPALASKNLSPIEVINNG